MAVLDTIALLFADPVGKIDKLIFDVVRREVHEWDNDITDHPVEPGAGLGTAADTGQPSSVSDNVRRKPDLLTLDCIISNTPMGILGAQAVTNVVNAINSATLTPGNLINAGPALDGFNQLSELRDGATLCDVITRFRTYHNMVITSAVITGTPEDGSGLFVTVNLKEVRLVTATVVESPAIPRGAKQKSKGPQPPGAPEPPKQEQGQSVFDALFSALP